MHLADVRHDGDGRRGERRERGDLPKSSHADLDDSRLVRRADAEERQRQADLVVVVRRRLLHKKACAEHGGRQVFGRRLAVRSRDGDDGDGKLPAPRGGDLLIGEQGVLRLEHDARLRQLRLGRISRYEHACRALFDRLRREVRAVKALAPKRDEERSRRNLSRIRHDVGKCDVRRRAHGFGLCRTLDVGERKVHRIAFFPRGDGLACDFLIVEVDRLVLQDLVILVPLARDDDDVVLFGERHGAHNRRAAVGDLFMALVADLLKHADLDLIEDARGIFRARIVRGHEYDIGKRRRDASHDRALRAVAVAAAAEHREDASRRNLPRRIQDVLQAVGRMRIVDDDGERLPRIDELEAPGHALESFERPLDRLGRDPFRERRADGAHDVVDIEDSRDAERKIHSAESACKRQLHAPRMDADVLGAKGGFLLHGIREMRTLRMGEHRLARRIVDIDDSRLTLLRALAAHKVEKARFRALVVFERLMVVEMILREVREYRRIEFDARHAVLIERMRRNLHDDEIHAAPRHIGERSLQDDDVGRRIVNRQSLILDEDLNRADESDLVPRLAQDGTRHVARRRLAVRARDADDAHLSRRVVMEKRHDDLKRRRKIRHAKNCRRTLGNLDLTLRQNRARALLYRLRDEGMAVDMQPLDGDEERPLRHLARIVHDVRDLRSCISLDFSALDERRQLGKRLHCHPSMKFIGPIPSHLSQSRPSSACSCRAFPLRCGARARAISSVQSQSSDAHFPFRAFPPAAGSSRDRSRGSP